MKYRLVAVVLALLVAIASAAAFSWLRPAQVTVSPVVRGKAIDAVYATGTVEAEDRVDVKAKTSGSVAEIRVKEGSVVERGDLLARIDNPVASYELKRGEAELRAATAHSRADGPQAESLRAQWRATDAELVEARKDLARVEKLSAAGSVSAAEVDHARARVSGLEGSLAANEAQQRALRIDLSVNTERQTASVKALASRVADTEVRAPLGGVVLGKLVEPGEVVGVNQPLFKVGDTSRLVIEATVDEADIGRVKDGSEGVPPSRVAVSLYAFSRQVFAGRVLQILPDANRDRKAFAVKIAFEAPPPGLRSGMTAEVNIIAVERDDALLVPAEAVADDALWVVRGGRAHRAGVVVGARDLLRAEILSGVGVDDRVVVGGHERLTEGARVTAIVREQERLQPLPDAPRRGSQGSL